MKVSRRQFLGQASCAAVSALPVLNTLLNLKLAGNVAAASSPDGYKALVCVFLSGGVDSFNLLVPWGATEYAEYSTVRQSLALPQDQLLAINPTVDPGLQLGLHPGMAEIRDLFEAGRAAFVSNVGTLVYPTTKAQYQAGSVKLPLGLFSHSDQIEQWQTSIPDMRSAVGWGGRLADLMQSFNADSPVSMNVSLSGANVWQSGDAVFEYAVSSTGAVALSGYNFAYSGSTASQTITNARSAALDSQLGMTYGNLLQDAFRSSKRAALDAYEQFSAATGGITLPASVVWPATNLANQFKMVAKTIAGHAGLGALRQTFFINFGGWDHHDELLNNQAAMVPVASQAIGAFAQCMAELGMDDSVVLFTASDFGRTLSSNARGSDHAWGGNQLVVGGGVQGRQIYGQYPSLAINGPQDIGRGRLVPTTSVDEFFAELAMWFGVSKSSLPLVLPNLGRFYDTAGSAPPIGMFP